MVAKGYNFPLFFDDPLRWCVYWVQDTFPLHERRARYVGMDAGQPVSSHPTAKQCLTERRIMAITAVSLSELAKLGPDAKQARLAQLAAARKMPLNGEVAALESKIHAFETRYEMSSETLIEQFKNHTVKETADVCTWMMLLDARKRLA